MKSAKLKNVNGFQEVSFINYFGKKISIILKKENDKLKITCITADLNDLKKYAKIIKVLLSKNCSIPNNLYYILKIINDCFNGNCEGFQLG